MAADVKDYLGELDARAPDQQYALIQDWLHPHKMTGERLAFFAQMRAERPVIETPECTLVANFVDVRDCLQMPKIMTVDLYKPKMGVTASDPGYLMAHDEDALHYREKSLMQGLLNRDDLPYVRKMVAERAAEVLSEADGSIELVNDYCRLVPVYLVKNYFGLDGVADADLIRWSYWNQYDAFNNQPHDMLSDETHTEIVAQHDQATRELVAYIATLMLRKVLRVKIWERLRMIYLPVRNLVYRIFGRQPPRVSDTMVTRMLRTSFAPAVDFNLVRVSTNAGGLLIGAIETTSQAVVQAIDYFVQNPSLMREAKAAARESTTDAFDAMVWEALRFVPIRPDIFRQAGEDYTIAKGTKHETLIKKGTIVRLLTQSAMFDPYSYDNPDAFEPGRTVYHNFVFGYGEHECLGKYVGVELIPEMVRQVILLGDLERDGPINYTSPHFPDHDGPFPEAYPVAWNVEASPRSS